MWQCSHTHTHPHNKWIIINRTSSTGLLIKSVCVLGHVDSKNQWNAPSDEALIYSVLEIIHLPGNSVWDIWRLHWRRCLSYRNYLAKTVCCSKGNETLKLRGLWFFSHPNNEPILFNSRSMTEIKVWRRTELVSSSAKLRLKVQWISLRCRLASQSTMSTAA